MEKRQHEKVFVSKVDEYDVPKIKSALISSFDALGIDLPALAGKKVVIKPNLIMKKSPDFAATTHPAVIEAVISALNDAGVHPVVAESPGGIYSAAHLKASYRVCGIEDAAKDHDCELNVDVSSAVMEYHGERAARSFDIIKPIADADVIIDVCKLKSHSLTKMSAAAKNLYGTIPGIIKFELHAANPDIDSFSSMLCDLDEMLIGSKTVIAITDGIVGMEGEGPTGGSPKKIGALLVSRDIFASDVIAAKILGLTVSDVPLLKEAASRGLIPDTADGIETAGDNVDDLVLSDFVLPKSQAIGVLDFFSKGKMGEFFMPRPYVTKKCRACGECVRSCPQKTIEIKKGRAKINAKKCIRCFCCQELCPFVAIKTRRNPILNVINKIK